MQHERKCCSVITEQLKGETKEKNRKQAAQKDTTRLAIQLEKGRKMAHTFFMSKAAVGCVRLFSEGWRACALTAWVAHPTVTLRRLRKKTRIVRLHKTPQLTATALRQFTRRGRDVPWRCWRHRQGRRAVISLTCTQSVRLLPVICVHAHTKKQ